MLNYIIIGNILYLLYYTYLEFVLNWIINPNIEC